MGPRRGHRVRDVDRSPGPVLPPLAGRRHRHRRSAYLGSDDRSLAARLTAGATSLAKSSIWSIGWSPEGHSTKLSRPRSVAHALSLSTHAEGGPDSAVAEPGV